MIWMILWGIVILQILMIKRLHDADRTSELIAGALLELLEFKNQLVIGKEILDDETPNMETGNL